MFRRSIPLGEKPVSRYRIDRSKTTQYSDAWVILALIITAIGLAAERPALVLIAALLLIIIPVAWVWNRLALRNVSYTRQFSEYRAFHGETLTLTLAVTNRKPLPVGWLKVDDQFPADLPLTEEGRTHELRPGFCTLTSLFSLRWFERVEHIHQIRCAQRGFYAFGPAHLKAGDMFGLFESECTIPDQTEIIVYPRVLPLEALGLPAKDPLGDRTARRRILEDPTRSVGIRDHQPGDDFRHIHWKATARRGRLQTRVFEPTTAYNLVVFLNVANFERFWHGYDPVLLEKTISVAASIANFATERRYAVGLVANGCLPESDQPIRVPPGRSPGQLVRILEMLAAVTPVASAPIEDLLISGSADLPWGSAIVLVTGIVTEAIAGALQRLHAAGRRVVLISLEERNAPPEMPGILTYHLPGLREASDDVAELAVGLENPFDAGSRQPHPSSWAHAKPLEDAEVRS